jgi:N-acetylneuraminic acid mutarotase
MKKGTKEIAWTLAKAIHDPRCPAREVVSDPWLFRGIIELVKSQMQFIIVTGDEYRRVSTELYSIPENSWNYGPALPYDIHAHGMAIVEDEIFVIGGFLSGNVTRKMLSLKIPSTRVFNFESRWQRTTQLKIGRAHHGVATFDGNIFIIGGMNRHGMLNSVEKFLVRERNWVNSTPMSTRKCAMGVTVVEKKIFVIGGFGCNDGAADFLSTAEFFDTETKEWSELPPMKNKRAEFAISVIENRFIWVFGGYTDHYSRTTDSIEVFDVATNTWSLAPTKLTFPRFGMTAITIDHRIFILGGSESEYNGTKTVEVLDIDEMKWSTVSKMLFARMRYSAVGF